MWIPSQRSCFSLRPNSLTAVPCLAQCNSIQLSCSQYFSYMWDNTINHIIKFCHTLNTKEILCSSSKLGSIVIWNFNHGIFSINSYACILDIFVKSVSMCPFEWTPLLVCLNCLNSSLHCNTLILFYSGHFMRHVFYFLRSFCWKALIKLASNNISY